LSGHPLEDYLEKMRENSTASAADFLRDEESGAVRVEDNAQVVVGGMIAAKSVKYTRNNQPMAFLTLEDLTGSVEVIVFPKDYERYGRFLNEEEKIFVVGRVSLEDEKDGKVICARVVPFAETRRQLWLCFADKDAYGEKEKQLDALLRDSDGSDEVCVYLAADRQYKKLGKNRCVRADEALLGQLTDFLGEKNVKVVEKGIENHA